MSQTLTIIRMPHSIGLDLPAYESSEAAGMDLRAACDENIVLAPEIGRASCRERV